MKMNLRKIMRAIWIALILTIVAGGMMSCEKEPVCTCTVTVYMDGWFFDTFQGYCPDHEEYQEFHYWEELDCGGN